MYCSGFVKATPVSRNLKVIAKFDASNGVLATDSDYVYLSLGTEDGIVAGNLYEVVRPTRKITNPYGRSKEERELGMHYLEIAYLRVALTQARLFLGTRDSWLWGCGRSRRYGVAIPVGAFPQPARPRPFNPVMRTNSGITGEIVTTKTVLLSYGSSFAGPSIEPVVEDSHLSPINRGIAGWFDCLHQTSEKANVSIGDVFIVYRGEYLDRRLFRTKEARSWLDKLWPSAN